METIMSSTPKQNGSTEAEATSTQVATCEVPLGNSARNEEIIDAGSSELVGPTAGKLPQSLRAAGAPPENITDVFVEK
jgi:hypothetical protein